MNAFVNFVKHDWYFAVPMFLMSLSALTLVIWRILLNLGARTDMNEFLPHFQQVLERDGVPGALEMCRARTDVIPRRLYVAGLEASKQGLAAVRRAMANALELEILPDLNFLLAPILAIAKIATMVGLLGTVLSMIGTFQKLSEARSDPTAHAPAIGLALFATALGLMTAIPLVFAHVLFKAWIARYETKMKSAALKLQALLQSTRPGSSAPRTAAAARP